MLSCSATIPIMTSNKMITAAKLAWLDEIGVDTYWLHAGDKQTEQPAEPKSMANSAPLTKPAAEVELVAEVESVTEVEPVTEVESVAEVEPIADTTPAQLQSAAELQSLTDLNNSLSLEIANLKAAVRPVLGKGLSQNPSYMLIGEQPGLDDIAVGEPFVGDQGKLLRAIFSSVRLPDSESVYMTNLLKYRLLNGVEPDDKLIKHYLTYLKQEINLVRPKNIIALGRIAASALLGNPDPKSLRGQMHTYELADGGKVPLWVSHQPIALLVHGARKEQAWRDFIAIAKYNSAN